MDDFKGAVALIRNNRRLLVAKDFCRTLSKFRTRREPKTRRTKSICRGMPWESTFMRKSKAEKKEIILKPWLYPMAAQNLSVILIQKRVRGWLCRVHRSASLLASDVAQEPQRGPKKIKHARRFRYPMQQFVANGNNMSDERGFYPFVATKLQAWFRMQRQRWRGVLDRYPLYHIAALQLQYAWKAYHQHKQNEPRGQSPSLWSVMSSRHCAALCIQNVWKSYRYRHRFRYYHDLLTFRSTGNPAHMLRAINPLEASLLDASMGAHVRFRLGGLTFPPTIYYKIFTCKPVCDLGAFSPKDYTIGRQSKQVARQGSSVHTTYIRVGNSYFRAQQQVKDAQLWYRRLENNGWRSVTAKVLAEANANSIAQTTDDGRLVRNGLYYSKFLRPKDRERSRRLKKRLWMQKLYAHGLVRATARPEIGCEHQIEKQPCVLFDVDFDDDYRESEAEELFQWASALDYDEYVDNWLELGRSAATDNELAEGNRRTKA